MVLVRCGAFWEASLEQFVQQEILTNTFHQPKGGSSEGGCPAGDFLG